MSARTELTDTQRHGYERDGYLCLDALGSLASFEAISEATDILLRSDPDLASSGFTRHILSPGELPIFDENEIVVAAEPIAADLLDSAVIRLFDMVVAWEPGCTHETPWHQDMAYSASPHSPAGTSIDHNTLQFCVPLDQENAGSCLRFLPGLHKDPMLEHRMIDGEPADPQRVLTFVDPTTGELYDQTSEVDLTTATDTIVEAAGATVHGPGAPHYTCSNARNSVRRRVYISNFVAVSATTPASD